MITLEACQLFFGYNLIHVFLFICSPQNKLYLSVYFFFFSLHLFSYNLHMISQCLGCLCLWDVKTCCSFCASDSLHLNLLPQFNRQQRKKGRGRELQSVSQPRQKHATELCHSNRKCKPARLEKNIRPYKRFILSFGRRS